MRTRINALALAAGLSACCITGAMGDTRVLIIGETAFATGLQDVRNKIVATGQVVGTVDTYNISSGVPTLAQLADYDAVLIWTNGPAGNNAALGNVLADYVDAGGGVVEMTFGFFDSGIGALGRWKTGNYTAMTATSQQQGSTQTLAARIVPAHPILAGVSSFSGGTSSYRCVTTVTPGSYRIADWSDGTPLIATRHAHAGKVAAVNFFPVSSDAGGGLWNAATSGGLIMANAVNFVSSNSIDVLICGAPSTTVWLNEVRDRVLESGRVGGTVDTWDLNAGLPSLDVLKRYDSVMVFTDRSPANPAAFGNTLADYVDSGGGVLLSTFASGIGITGRFASGGYMPLVPSGQSQNTPLTLGSRLIPQHPLLRNVGTFSGGNSSFHQVGGLAPGAIDIADWSNGRPLVAVMPGKAGRIAALNFFPVSSVSNSSYWDRTTDGGALLGNAINWIARNDNDVLILSDTTVPNGQADVAATLRPYVNGKIQAVDYLTSTPSLPFMRKFDSVLLFTNVNPQDRVALGNRLAWFVDGGGGVVDMYGSNLNSYGPTGRWVSDNYSGLNPGAVTFTSGIEMSLRRLPKHPVLRGVTEVNLGSGGYHSNASARAGSVVLADLGDGTPLAVERSTAAGRVVSLNFFPVSSLVFDTGWDASTQGGRMMGNAVNHVARSDSDALVFATEDVNGNLVRDVLGRIRATSRLRGGVDAYDNRSVNPPLGLLLAYDSVLAWSNFGQPDGAALGDLLSQYADRGGGVVTATGLHYNVGYAATGRWTSAPYSPALLTTTLVNNASATLGARNEPGHPVLSGINAFALGASALGDFTTLSSVGHSIANLSNGMPFIAESKPAGARQVLALNMFPASTDVSSIGWNPAFRGGLLMSNALTYVATERPCETDFNNDGFLDFFDYSDFVDCFEASNCPTGRDADFNGDGFVDFFDYGDFVDAFERGC